jgi:hypothetical protein
MFGMASADLLLHPLRLRIVQAFLGERQLTTGQLRAELGDIAPATLYRQVAVLVKAGVLLAVDERPVRGTIERTYALSMQDAQVSAEGLRAMRPEDHRRAFMGFIAGLIADFDNYLDTGDVDLERDVAGYRSIGLWLTNEEMIRLVAEIGAAVQSRVMNHPAPGRTRRMLSTVLIPTPAAATPSAPAPAEPTPDKPTPDGPTPDKPTPDGPTPAAPEPGVPTPVADTDADDSGAEDKSGRESGDEQSARRQDAND